MFKICVDFKVYCINSIRKVKQAQEQIQKEMKVSVLIWKQFWEMCISFFKNML